MNRKLNSEIGIVLVVAAAGLACSMLRPKRPLTWHVTLESYSSTPEREAATRQTIAMIEKRLDAFGVPRFEVKAQDGQILVSLPDVADHQRVKDVLTAWGKLELVAIVSPPNPSPVQTYVTSGAAVASLNSGGAIPVNRRVLVYPERELNSGLTMKWVVVESPAIVEDGDLRNAVAMPDRPGSNDYDIQFSLKKPGAEKFGAWTGANTNRYLGVVLNDSVMSHAYVKAQLFDTGLISLSLTKQSAQDLALVFNSGSFPAPVRFVGEGANK